VVAGPAHAGGMAAVVGGPNSGRGRETRFCVTRTPRNAKNKAPRARQSLSYSFSGATAPILDASTTVRDLACDGMRGALVVALRRAVSVVCDSRGGLWSSPCVL
jgi:hypothetical protein